MIDRLTDVVLVVTGFQLLLLAVVLLAGREGRPLPRLLLAGFLVTKVSLILRWSVFRFELLQPREQPGLYVASCAGFFVLAPLLYLAIRALCFRDFVIRRATLVHLAPAAVMAALGVLAVRVELGEATLGLEVLDGLLVGRYWTLFWAANLVQIPVYIVAMYRIVRRYQRQLGEVHSAGAPFELRWLVALLAVISLHWVFVASRTVLAAVDLGPGQVTAVLDLLSITIFLVFTTILVARGLAHARVFPGIEEIRRGTSAALPDGGVARCAERLVKCMRDDRPYLEPSLTIDDLAQRVEVQGWQLSRVLNRAFGLSFCTFVNRHRVEEAKRQLADPGCNARTMLQILHESGFSSKSTFNDAFKRHTGMTPTEYRRRAQRRAPEARPGSVVRPTSETRHEVGARVAS